MRRRWLRGLTLLELMVVVAIMALATAGVSVAMRSPPGEQLVREAERLAALLEAGRAASRASGEPVYWLPTAEGFRFEGVPLQTLPGNWLAPGVRVQSSQRLVLGPEPIIGAQRVVLESPEAPGRTVQVASDGLRPFAVTEAAAAQPRAEP